MLNSNEKEELRYLAQGGHTISRLAVSGLLKRKLIKMPPTQSFSNSPHTGVEVNITRKGLVYAQTCLNKNETHEVHT